MTVIGPAALDPILRTRLELLEQVSDEVKRVIQAMVEQREKLTALNSFLRPDGALHDVEKEARTIIGDSRNRLENLQSSLIGHGLSEYDTRMLNETLDRTRKAGELVESLSRSRITAYDHFQYLSAWSVAGLAEDALDESERDYNDVIWQIRQAPNPWERYATEIRGGGHELVTRYVQLLGGMAVRGFGLEAEIMGDVQVLRRQLERPLRSSSRGAIGMRSPLTMLGTRHFPLGYPDWSLWALPLFGQAVGEQVVGSGVITQPQGGLRQALCADAYALYVLGPCYPYAAIFLEMDPSSDTDDARAQLLLDRLPSCAGQKDPAHPLVEELTTIAVELRDSWNAARRVCTGRAECRPAPDDIAAVDQFLTVLRAQYPEIVYNRRITAIARVTSEVLVDLGQDIADLAPPMLELVTAIWFARLKRPDLATAIHHRAKAMARNEPSRPPVAPGITKLWGS